MKYEHRNRMRNLCKQRKQKGKNYKNCKTKIRRERKKEGIQIEKDKVQEIMFWRKLLIFLKKRNSL